MNDEAEIQQWFDSWIESTVEGKPELANTLVADDAVFFLPGVGSMGKEPFILAACGTEAPGHDFDLDSKIEDMHISGDMAWVTSRHRLDITEKATGTTSRMSGHALSVLERRDGQWVTVREASTMTAEKSAG